VTPAPYRPSILLFAAAVGAMSGIVYELLLASLASYLVGATVVVFSLTVGLFLAAMGLGAWLSRFVHERLLASFVAAEITLGVFGAIAPLLLFVIYAAEGPFLVAHGLSTIIIGALVGLELPLLTRMLESDGGLRVAISRALALDYVGCLVGSVVFPLVLMPWVGLVGSAMLVGALGPALGLAVAWRHQRHLESPRLVMGIALASALGLVAAFVPSRALGELIEADLYDAPVVHSAQSAYQRIILTRHGQDVRLFLDGDLQFSSIDEQRYHEALVHPAMAAMAATATIDAPRRVLVLGAGDGLALREVLKYRSVERAVLIELDPEVLALARHAPLSRLNGGSLDDTRVSVVVADAFTALADGAPPLDVPFDVIIADFPDPDAEPVARLYSASFYATALRRLAPGGVLVTQATSAFQTPKAFTCIGRTLESVGLATRPYLVDVPSFGGPWGFWLAARQRLPAPESLALTVPTRHLTPALLANLFDLPADLAMAPDVRPNRLLDPVILQYHRDLP